MKKISIAVVNKVIIFTIYYVMVTTQFAEAEEPPAKGLSYILANPIGFPTIQDFLVGILNVIIVIATPIVVLFIILAGFKYVTARGNPAQIQEATQALTYAIIGGILIIGAVAISKIIANFVTAFAS